MTSLYRPPQGVNKSSSGFQRLHWMSGILLHCSLSTNGTGSWPSPFQILTCERSGEYAFFLSSPPPSRGVYSLLITHTVS